MTHRPKATARLQVSRLGPALARRFGDPRAFLPAPSLERFRQLEPALVRDLLGAEPDPSVAIHGQLEGKLDRLLRSARKEESLAGMAEGCAAILDSPARNFFVASLVGSARHATRERRARGQLRSVWGTTPILNIIPASRAERLLGIESETLVYTSYYITHEFDVNLKQHCEWLEATRAELVPAFFWLVFLWAMLRYDVFYYFNDRGILVPPGGYGSTLGIQLEEMRLLRRAGKRLYTLAYGADHRTRSKTLASGKYNFCMDCPEVGRFCVCDDEGGARMLATISKHATAMLATGLSVDYIPNPVNLHYLVLDTTRLQPAFTPPPKGRPLRVVHAPNHPHFKGTRHLEEAVAKLQAEGCALELVRVTAVSNQEVLELVRSADVVADQFIGGSFGYFAVEAMALGKPVLSYVRDPSRVLAPDEFPIVNANPDTLVAALRRLHDHPWLLADLSQRSRRYVEQHASLPAFAERLRRLHLEFGSPGWAVFQQLAPPRLRSAPGFLWTRSRVHLRRVKRRAPRLGAAAVTLARRLRDGVQGLGQRKRTTLAWLRTARNLLSTPAYWRALLPRRHTPPSSSHEIVMLVISDARSDPRVEREARALAAGGFEVKVIYPDAYSPRFAEQPIDWGKGISFRPAPADAGEFVTALPWLWGGPLHRMALEERPFAFHAHDLNTALVALSAARHAGARFVADFHEWYSENVSWDVRRQEWRPHSPGKRRLFRAVERLVLRQADEVVTVCDEIAHQLGESVYRRTPPVSVVRNIPRLDATPTREYSSLRDELGIPESWTLLLWQGGIGPTRFIEPIIQSLRHLPRVVFAIRGPGLELFGAAYRSLAREEGVEDRLVLLPPVPSRDVVAAARGADVGIWTLPNCCKNFYYALPNKIFEYLAAGLPVAAAGFPEARRLVEGHAVGVCFDPYSPASIAEAVQRLTADAASLARFRRNVPAALLSLRAEDEWARLVALYRGLATRSGVTLRAAPEQAGRDAGASG